MFEIVSSLIFGSIHGAALYTIGRPIMPSARNEHGEGLPVTTMIVVLALIGAALTWGLHEHDSTLLRSVVGGLSWVLGGTVTQAIAARNAKNKK